MATTISQELEEEFLSTIRKGLPTAHEAAADEVITATSPLLPGRTGLRRVTAKAA